MSSQLSTLDHTVMGILLKSSVGLSVRDLSRGSKATKKKTLKSVEKLMEFGFVSRRAECGALPLYSAVLDCPYFPPVAFVAERAFLAFDDAEFSQLVADVEKRANTKTLH